MGKKKELPQAEEDTPVSNLFNISIEQLAETVKKYQTRDNIEEIIYLKEELRFDMIEEVLRTRFDGGIPGDQRDLEERVIHFGSNKPPPIKPKGFCKIFLETFNDFVLKLLLGAAIVSIIANMVVEEDHRDIGNPSSYLAWIEGFAILVAVAVVSLVGAFSDWSKEKQFMKMNNYSDSKKLFNVYRNGKVEQVNEVDLVVGDVIKIEAGMNIPADGIVLESKGVTTDEAAMTGESDQLKKESIQVCDKRIVQKMNDKGLKSHTQFKHHDIPSPVLLSGTVVCQGEGTFMVIVVGDNSAIGVIRSTFRVDEAESTPLQQKLEAIARDIGKVREWQIAQMGLIAAVLTVIILFIRFFITESKSDGGFEWDKTYIENWLRFLIIGLTIIVVAVPEGLPLAVTISLAYSMSKMLKDKNFVKKLMSCEIMGSATAICSDKTGTLTKNEMNVTNLWQGRDIELRSAAKEFKFNDYWKDNQIPDLLMQACICNTNAELDSGLATEMALLKMADKFGAKIHPLRQKHVPKQAIRFQFTSERKRMSTILENVENGTDYGKRIHMKGAAEIVLKRCNRYIDAKGDIVDMDQHKAKDMEENIINSYAKRALRTICIAYKEVQPGDGGPNHEDELSLGNPVIEENDYICIGILGIKDVIRDEVEEAIRKCQRAGIKVRMVTGDNPITAVAIAKECGIIQEETEGCVMCGVDFEKAVGGLVRNRDPKDNKKILSEKVGNQDAFNRILSNLNIMARSRPEDKYLMVTGLKEQGEVVAVTGDGTNDAPALKKANVGFAMGIKGTPVAKDAADIIIEDDNFASIVKAVKWGRNIYDNIKRFLQFQLTVNVVALITAFVASCIITDSVLTPVQLLWVNLIMDSLASLALATDPPSEKLLENPPIRKDEYIVTRKMVKHILGQSVYQCIVTFTIIFAGEFFIPQDATTSPSNPKDATLIHPGDIQSYPKERRNEFGASRHFTIVFNAFVWMQLFNEINCRKINDEINCFAGICQNKLFIIVWVLTAGVQAILITWGNRVFSVSRIGLTWYQWLICLAFGFGSYLFRFVLLLVPDKICPQLGKKQKDPLDPNDKSVLNIKRNHTVSFKDKNLVIRGPRGASFGSMSQQHPSS